MKHQQRLGQDFPSHSGWCQVTGLICVNLLQVQKEAATREYHNLRYDQPYQTAIYHASVLLQSSRWHFTEYEAELEDLSAGDVEVSWLSFSPLNPVLGAGIPLFRALAVEMHYFCTSFEQTWVDSCYRI